MGAGQALLRVGLASMMSYVRKRTKGFPCRLVKAVENDLRVQCWYAENLNMACGIELQSTKLWFVVIQGPQILCLAAFKG